MIKHDGLWVSGLNFNDVVALADRDPIDVVEKLLEDLQYLKEQLDQYENPKNWTRPYNYKGSLINEHALYLPKVNIEAE